MNTYGELALRLVERMNPEAAPLVAAAIVCDALRVPAGMRDTLVDCLNAIAPVDAPTRLVDAQLLFLSLYPQGMGYGTRSAPMDVWRELDRRGQRTAAVAAVTFMRELTQVAQLAAMDWRSTDGVHTAH